MIFKDWSSSRIADNVLQFGEKLMRQNMSSNEKLDTIKSVFEKLKKEGQIHNFEIMGSGEDEFDFKVVTKSVRVRGVGGSYDQESSFYAHFDTCNCYLY